MGVAPGSDSLNLVKIISDQNWVIRNHSVCMSISALYWCVHWHCASWNCLDVCHLQHDCNFGYSHPRHGGLVHRVNGVHIKNLQMLKTLVDGVSVNPSQVVMSITPIPETQCILCRGWKLQDDFLCWTNACINILKRVEKIHKILCTDCAAPSCSEIHTCELCFE